MKKRILSLILAAVMIFTLLPMGASAAEIFDSGTCGDNLTWTLKDGVLTISGTGDMYDYSISSVPWCSNRSSITSVVIENGITSICDYAIYFCDKLMNVKIPDSVTRIGKSAFESCRNLGEIEIPNGVTSINSRVFKNCSNLTSVIIPDSVSSIGGYAFDGCSSLESVTIPNSVKSIGREAFDGTPWLFSKGSFPVVNGILLRYLGSSSSVTIPNSVTSIGEYAFYDRSNLKNVTIPKGVTSICDGAFSDCIVLNSITIPDKVTSIGNYAFSNCSSLESVTIPDSVTSIGNYAFVSCRNLSNVTIGSGVMSIGNAAFSNCNKLMGVRIKNIEAWCRIEFGSYDANPLYYANYLSLEGIVRNLTIPDSITKIGNHAFNGCSGLTSVTIPNSVTSIGNSAFSGCSGLTSVTIPDSVTSIGNSAFYGCDKLTSVTIPNNVTSIGDRAFCNCSELTSITIPESVTSIGEWAFAYCYDLIEIHFNAKSATASFNVFEYAGRYTDGITVIFGDRVKIIPANLFYRSDSSNRPNIKNVIFCGNAPNIGDNTFYKITASAYYPYGNNSWTEENRPYRYGNGYFNWKPYSNAEIEFCECSVSKKRYYLGEELDKDSISFIVKRTDGCIESYDYSTGFIKLGEYDMSTAGIKTVSATCRDAEAELKFYVHGITTKTIDSADFPESSHNYEDNLDKTYTYSVPGALKLKVMFSESTMIETNVDYIYVNGVKYTGNALAGKTIEIDGDTLTIRLVSDESDTEYGFSIDKIEAVCADHDYTAEITKPTCTEQGYTKYTCECGESYIGVYMASLGHNYGEDGVCSRCGGLDPNYDPDAPKCRILVSNETARAGEEVTVAVSLEDNPGIMAMALNVEYDKSKLELLGVENGIFEGLYYSGTAVWIEAENSTDSGVILKLKFKVLDSVEDGDIEISLKADNGDIANYDEEEVKAELVSGKITVVSGLSGDMNGDGEVNALDLVRLAKYVSGEHIEIATSADVTGDGKVNAIDLVRLKKYIAGENVELH